MNNTLYSEIKRCLIAVPTQWDGKDGILEMKETGYPHWRQMEWIGFYFQFLCEKHLKKLFQFQKPRYDKVSFDGFYKIPFDFNTYSFPLLLSTSLNLFSTKELHTISAAEVRH